MRLLYCCCCFARVEKNKIEPHSDNYDDKIGEGYTTRSVFVIQEREFCIKYCYHQNYIEIIRKEYNRK